MSNRALIPRIATAVALFLGTFGHAYAQGYPGPQGGFYVYGPDHEYHLLSRNQPFMVLRQPAQPSVPIVPVPGPLPPVAGPPALDPTPGPPLWMQESREAVIRAGEEHCRRFADPEVCHEKK